MTKEIKIAFKQVIAFWESDRIYSEPIFGHRYCALCKICKCEKCPLNYCLDIEEVTYLQEFFYENKSYVLEGKVWRIDKEILFKNPESQKEFEQLRQAMVKELKKIYREKSGVQYRK